MTVEELIEHLRKFPPDAIVLCYQFGGAYYEVTSPPSEIGYRAGECPADSQICEPDNMEIGFVRAVVIEPN